MDNRQLEKKPLSRGHTSEDVFIVQPPSVECILSNSIVLLFIQQALIETHYLQDSPLGTGNIKRKCSIQGLSREGRIQTRRP